MSNSPAKYVIGKFRPTKDGGFTGYIKFRVGGYQVNFPCDLVPDDCEGKAFMCLLVDEKHIEA